MDTGLRYLYRKKNKNKNKDQFLINQKLKGKIEKNQFKKKLKKDQNQPMLTFETCVIDHESETKPKKIMR